jgi:putative transposase
MLKQLYTYKFALKPTRLQAILLNKHCGAVRYLYNYFLNKRHLNYRSNKQLEENGEGESKKYINYYDQARDLTLLKQNIETGWLKEVNSQTLQFALKTLDGAYNDFFKGKTGLPVYHSKNHSNSFRVPQFVEIKYEKENQGDSTTKNNKTSKCKILIPKFREGIVLIDHRQMEGEIKFATIVHNPDDTYHVSITVEKTIEEPPKTFKSVGIDIGIKDTFVTSDGQKTGNPKAIYKYQKKLRFFQQKLSRLIKVAPKKPLLRDGKQVFTNKGKPKFYAVKSNNIKKATIRVAKYHTKIKNRRQDHIHKATTNIIRKYDTIVIEDLNTKGMVKNHKLAKSIHDSSFGEVKRQLEYKSKWYGRNIIKIDRFYPSSKTCSQCALINNNLSLKDRDWTCTCCGKYHDRDTNAAINILAKGISMLVGTQA